MMRVGVLQGVYPRDDTQAARDEAAALLSSEVDRLDGSLDLLVMPEYGNCPGASTLDQVEAMTAGSGAALFEQVRQTAARLGIQIAFNGLFRADGRFRNTTILLGRDGEVVERYEKTHLTRFESDVLGLEPGWRIPVAELSDGTRLGFATCFELYFPEYFESIAARQPDLIAVPTYQRSEERRVLTFQMQARATDSGAFLLRSSYLVPDITRAGESAVVHPDGRVLTRVGDVGGVAVCEIDPRERWVRGRSAVDEATTARTIIEESRRPLLYRARDFGVQQWNEVPRAVAHRGFSHACPENTMEAFEAAIALGSDEVELDIWPTRDRELAVMHDDTVDRTTNGTGKLSELDWATVAGLDAGSWFGEAWRGVAVPRAEEVFARIGPRQTLNIHIKDIGDDGWVVTAIADLVAKYQLTDTVYLAGDHDVMEAALDLAPDLPRACLADQNSWQMVDHAIRYGCTHLQFGRTHVDKRQVARAHEAGIRCNLFWADTAADATRFLDMGIDSLLCNDLAAVLPTIRQYGRTLAP